MYDIIINKKKYKIPLEPYEPNNFITYDQIVCLIHPKQMNKGTNPLFTLLRNFSIFTSFFGGSHF